MDARHDERRSKIGIRIFIKQSMSKRLIVQLLNAIAICSILAGGFGMLFSFQFLWSAKIEDLIGAGFPFIAGSVLFGSGLLALAILNKESK